MSGSKHSPIDQNTGDQNTGHQNTGHQNTSHENTGNQSEADGVAGDPVSSHEPASARHAEDRHSEVGEFIRLQRERANLSLRRLADRAGISNPYLSQIERGVRKPSAEILKRISRALSISAETLYTRAGLIEAGATALPVVDAIEADPGLSPRHKQVLLDVYRTLIISGSPPDTDPEK